MTDVLSYRTISPCSFMYLFGIRDDMGFRAPVLCLYMNICAAAVEKDLGYRTNMDVFFVASTL